MTLRKETRPKAWRQRRETVSGETVKDYSTAGGTHVTVYELNREIDRWDARNQCAESKRGYGIPNVVRAHGGTWLAAMATLLGTSVHTVKVGGVPRPAVEYRGVWFVNFEGRARA